MIRVRPKYDLSSYEEYNIDLIVYCNINHRHHQLCSSIVEWLGIDSIESYKKFDFNTLIGEYSKSKIEAFKELQNRLINEVH
jgi:hypothetical protein